MIERCASVSINNSFLRPGISVTRSNVTATNCEFNCTPLSSAVDSVRDWYPHIELNHCTVIGGAFALGIALDGVLAQGFQAITNGSALELSNAASLVVSSGN